MEIESSQDSQAPERRPPTSAGTAATQIDVGSQGHVLAANIATPPLTPGRRPRAAETRETPSPLTPLGPGVRVRGWHKSGAWYGAKVVRPVEGGRYLLEWQDGDTQDTLKSMSEIRALETLDEIGLSAGDGLSASPSDPFPVARR